LRASLARRHFLASRTAFVARTLLSHIFVEHASLLHIPQRY
jgi:hypothetical protein